MTKIISRKEAIYSGLKWYFTGDPCKNGHVAERQCSNRKCRICSKQKSDAWRLKNPEKSRESSTRWKKRNPDRYAMISASWRKNNRHKVSEYNKLYISGWVEKNREKVRFANSMRRAFLLQSIPKWLTDSQKSEIKEMYALAKRLEEKTGEKFHVDHIVPICGKFVRGLHVPWNLQVIPKIENLKKGNRI